MVQTDDILAVFPSDPDTLFTLLHSRIDMLHLSSENLRKGLVDCQKNFTNTFQPLVIEVKRLRGNICSEPCLTGALLHSTWDNISWVKSLLSSALQTVLLSLKTSHLQSSIKRYITSVLAFSSSRSLALASKLGLLESTLSGRLPCLCNLHSICFSGVMK